MPSDGAMALLSAGEEKGVDDSSDEAHKCAEDILEAVTDKDADALHDALMAFLECCSGGGGVTIKLG